jgi:hypothetical protein
MCHVRIAPSRIGRAPQVARRRTLRLIICPSAASLNTLTIVGAVDPRLDASRPAFGHDEVERGARAVVHDFGNRPRADWAGVQDTCRLISRGLGRLFVNCSIWKEFNDTMRNIAQASLPQSTDGQRRWRQGVSLSAGAADQGDVPLPDLNQICTGRGE